MRDPSNGRVPGAPGKEARREDGRGGQTAGKEKENDEQEDEDREASLTEAL